MSEKEAVNLSSLEVEGLLSVFIGLLSEKALRYLGLPLKEVDEPVRDLKRASIAINSINGLIEQIELLIPEEAVKQYRSLLSELQIQYVRHTHSP